MKSKLLLIFLSLSLILAILPKTAQAATPMSDITSFTGDVVVEKNGLTKFSLRLTQLYTNVLNWNLGVKDADKLIIKADGVQLKSREYSLDKKSGYLTVQSDPGKMAAIWDINFQTRDAFTINNRENFRWLAVTTNHSLVEYLNITLHTMVPIKENSRTAYRVYAFHGVESSDASLLDENTIVYQGTMLGSASGFSIFASWPCGSINFPLIQKLRYDISDLPVTNWLIFGLILPAISLLLLAYLYLRQKTQVILNSTREKLDRPPSDLPPLQVGILVDKKIYPKTLMATILDLCEKGYLIIIKDKKQVVFAKRKQPDNELCQWEKNLIEEITLNDRVWACETELRKTTDRNLFSPKIRACYEEAYRSTTDMGYYHENPHLVRVRYKIYAIILYLLSLIGLAWVVISMQTPYLLIPLLGALFSTIIIIKFAYLLPTQSRQGLLARKEWLKYANFLRQKEPVESIMAISGVFYRYLPYALVLNVESQWARRFSQSVMVKPSWLLEREITDVESENTLHQVLDIIHKLTDKISLLHGPTVK